MAAPRHDPLFLAIDFGTTTTVVAGMRPGGEPELVRFSGPDGRSGDHLPSAVFVGHGGEVLVGREAVEATALEPLGGEPTPKALIQDGRELASLGRPMPVVALVGAVIGTAYRTACNQLGTPAQVALTCPVAWAPDGGAAVKRRVLRAAAQLAGIRGEPVVLNEAEAAAHDMGDGAIPIEEGELLGIYDLGGGTCDIAMLRRDQGRLTVVALAEVEMGGEEFDYLLYSALVERLELAAAAALLDPVPATPAAAPDADVLAWQRCRVALAAEVKEAKERLTARDAVSVRVPEPVGSELRLTANDVDALLGPPIRLTCDELLACIRRALETPHDGDGVASLYLVGGASQLPLVGSTIAHATSIPTRLAEHPRAAVARGALRVLEAHGASGRPTRRGGGRLMELHARRVHACGGLGPWAYLVHDDPSDGLALSRMALARGALDLSVPLPNDLLASDTVVLATGPGGVAAWTPRQVRLWDGELRPVELPAAPPGKVLSVHIGGTGAWILHVTDTPALALALRTVSVPPAGEETNPQVGDMTVVPALRLEGQRAGGAPGLVVVARRMLGRTRLLVAVYTQGVRGSEQQIFAAEEDGRLRKLQTRQAGPWLLDWLPTAFGDVVLEGEMAPVPHSEALEPRVTRAALEDATLLEVEQGATAAVTMCLIPSGPAGLVGVGAAGVGWELHRIDPTSHSADAAAGEIRRERLAERRLPVRRRQGLHLVHRDGDGELCADRPALPNEDGAWLVTRTVTGAEAAVRLLPDGRILRAPLPDGARLVGSAAGRLYITAPAGERHELRSVTVPT